MTARPEAAPRRDWATIAAAFAAMAVVVSVWVALDRRPPEWDHANHLERVILCAGDMARGDVSAVLERSSFYPPLVPCLAGLAYRLAPSDTAAAQAVTLLFLALGMSATYVLGRDLVGGAAGVAAALIFVSAPFVVFSTLHFDLDLPLAALVALAFVLLLRTEGFSRVEWSFLTGLVFGLGMLTKPPFAAYVLPPLALVVWRVRTRRAAMNLALAGVVGTALSLPWYALRLVGLPAQIGNRSFRQAAESRHPEIFSWTGLSFYPRWSLVQFGVLAVLVCCIGLVLAVRRRQSFLLVALLVPLGLLTLLQNKNLRYTLPLLPVAAVFAGTGLNALCGRWRRAGSVALVLMGVLQITGTAFGMPPSEILLPGLELPWVVDSRPTRTDWKHREILALIARHSAGGARTVSVVPNFAVFSVSNFRYYALRDNLPLRFQRAWDGEPIGIDYMVLKTGNVGPSWTADKPNRIAERLRTDGDLARVFPTIGAFPLPDGSAAIVRARSIPPVPGARPAALGEAIASGLRRQLPDYARDVEGLRVALEYDDAILQGRVRRLEITATAATVGELRRRNTATLPVHDLRIVVDDLLVNPYSAHGAGRFDPLDAGRVTIERATILARDFQSFLHGLKDFRRASVSLKDGAMAFVMEQPGPDVEATVRLLPARGQPFALAADRVRLGSVPVPQALVNFVVRNYDPTPGLVSRLPVPVEVGRISIGDDGIRISTDGAGARER